jgi:nicotinamide-nucleotide amidase
MQAEIVMIGTELLLGQVQDTNATFMAQRLAENGINLYQKTTVGDNAARIRAVLEAALDRADVVLCSGGLGPTEDDITRECVAEVLGRPLEYHPELFETVAARFAHLRMTITDNNKKQAYLFQGAQAIENPNGTAPGILVDDPRGVIVCMPGVPKELYPMLTDRVIPWLRERFSLSGVLHYRVLKVCGMGESRIDAAIGDLITSHENPSIGLLASMDVVRIRIAAKAESVEAANALIDPVEAAVRERLGDAVLGYEEDTLEKTVDQLLTKRGWRLRVIETGSGGMLCQRLTAAGAVSFAGGEVRGTAVGGGVPDLESPLDRTRRYLLASSDTCILVLEADLAEHRTAAVFGTPEGVQQWEIGDFGTGERNQVRTAVSALEGMRRRLTGAL